MHSLQGLRQDPRWAFFRGPTSPSVISQWAGSRFMKPRSLRANALTREDAYEVLRLVWFLGVSAKRPVLSHAALVSAVTRYARKVRAGAPPLPVEGPVFRFMCARLPPTSACAIRTALEPVSGMS